MSRRKETRSWRQFRRQRDRERREALPRLQMRAGEPLLYNRDVDVDVSSNEGGYVGDGEIDAGDRGPHEDTIDVPEVDVATLSWPDGERIT